MLIHRLIRHYLMKLWKMQMNWYTSYVLLICRQHPVNCPQVKPSQPCEPPWSSPPKEACILWVNWYIVCWKTQIHRRRIYFFQMKRHLACQVFSILVLLATILLLKAGEAFVVRNCRNALISLGKRTVDVFYPIQTVTPRYMRNSMSTSSTLLDVSRREYIGLVNIQ